MSLKTRLIRLWSAVEGLIFQNHACLACRKEIPDGTKFSLCKNCFDDIERIEGNVCATCGDVILEDNLYCDKCEKVKYYFDKSHSFAFYEDVGSRMIKRFKYNGRKYYAKYLAELMVLNKDYFDGIDYITFVPIGRKRKSERGFNQAEEMAKELGGLANIPVIETLVKVKSERHQAGLTQKERSENLSGTIELKAGAEKIVKGKNILIIDDVFTTGATLSECAKQLLSKRGAKPRGIFCYTFAKTRLNSTNTGQIQQKTQKEIKTK